MNGGDWRATVCKRGPEGNGSGNRTGGNRRGTEYVERGMERNHLVRKKPTMQETGGEKNMDSEAQGEEGMNRGAVAKQIFTREVWTE